MSKSRKKQKARERERASELRAPEPVPADAPATPAQPSAAVDEALFERVAEAAMAAGLPRQEGGRFEWLYNGPELSIKYVEESESTPRRLMVAAFRRGVVFHVEGDRLLAHQPDGWEHLLPGNPEPADGV